MIYEPLTVRSKNFRVENFRDLSKTFEILEIHDFDPSVKTFEVFSNKSCTQKLSRLLSLKVDESIANFPESIIPLKYLIRKWLIFCLLHIEYHDYSGFWLYGSTIEVDFHEITIL